MVAPNSAADILASRRFSRGHSRFLVRGLLCGMAVAILVTALFEWAPCRALSRGFHDFLHRMPLGASREVEVLVVQLGPENPGAMGRLLDQLGAAKPRAILVSGSTSELAEASRAAGRHPGTPYLAGVLSAPSSGDPNRFVLQQEPPPIGLPWGLRVLPAPDQGVLRIQACRVDTPDGALPTVEGAFSARVLRRGGRGDGFQVDFRDLQNRIPRVEANRILAGEVPTALAGGKTLIIGRINASSVTTPLDGARSPVTDLEFHAAALNTLLHGRGLISLPMPLTFFLSALAAGLSYLRVRRRDPLRMIPMALLCVALQFGLGWGLLAGPGILWPAFPLLAAHALGMAISQADCFMEFRDALRLLVLDSGRHLSAPHRTAQEADSETDWGFIGPLLEQFLQVKRSVFLTRSGPGQGLAGEWALHCDFSAIREPRRDVRRDPFAQALKAGGPIRCADRDFLVPEPGEIQYLVPLTAYGDIEGFWAVALPAGGDPHGTGETLKAFALQIAEMLHARRIRTRKDVRQLRDEYYSSLTVWAALGAVQLHTGELDRNFRILDALFDHLSTPFLIYDLSGRVVRKNPAMQSLLAVRNVQGERASILELVHTLTGADREGIQFALRQVLLHRESQAFFSDPRGAAPLRVTLKPLAQETGIKAGPSDLALRPFGLEGLVLEVEDRPRVPQSEAIPAPMPPPALGIYEAPLLSGDSIQVLPASPKTLPEELRCLDDWTHEIEHQLELLFSAAPHARLNALHAPEEADAGEAFRSALKRLDGLFSTRRIQVHTEGGPTGLPVTANSGDLPKVFSSVLNLLAEDARQDSVLHSAWGRQGGFLVLTLANEGHGLPRGVFQSVLDREGALETASLRSLMVSSRLLKSWGGRLESQSEFGQGTRVSLHLRCPVMER